MPSSAEGWFEGAQDGMQWPLMMRCEHRSG
jgi:hypothetical protein